MDFVFYDLETSGLSAAYDQPLQFAAILTDENFVEKDRIDLRCRLAPHIIPSPQALIITGVNPDQLIDKNLPSYFEFAQEILALTEEWAPAIWTGYNSMRFDEEFLRQTFYQNLQPSVYATQFNDNTRFDLMPAIHAAHVRNPDILDWPVDEDGIIRFKLDRLAPANGFNAHNAHDALGDVEATIHMAKKIAFADAALWDELVGNAQKSVVQTKIESFQPCELVTRFGAGVPRSIFGCFCGYSPDNRNQAGFFDLDMADPGEIIAADDAALMAALVDVPRIISSFATNKAPALLEIPKPNSEHVRRAQIIADAPEFRARVGQAMADRFVDDPQAPPKSVEKQIYGDFYSPDDKKLLREFQIADWPERKEMVSHISDVRLRQLGRRLISFYSPELLSPGEQSQLSSHLRDKWNTADTAEPEWTTLAKALAEIADLKTQGNVEPALIADLETFIDQRTTQHRA